MCGIAGFINGGSVLADRRILEAMTSTLAHRGPDGDGFYTEGPVGMGHRRLSVIDVAGGAQPLSNEDGSVWVIYNGEIYNEPQLRHGLIARGHRFATKSDTESLVHLYEEMEERLTTQLNGMYAYAIWDSTKSKLVLSRDRMGQKPLYFARLADGGLVFGSEPKALLAHPSLSRNLNPDSLARYLFYEYLPAPFSIWSGIEKLPAGSTLIWEAGKIRITEHWISPEPDADDPNLVTSPSDFWDEFRAAVGRHRRSDVPLGVFLSGGIDSSSVAAALAELEDPAGIHTFSIGFDDPSFDESGYARAVAKHLGTTHHERTFSVDDVLNFLPDVATWLDEPLGDASILPTYLLSRFAREEVTVALGGDGADELLAGYPTFKAEEYLAVYQRLPAFARRLIRGSIHKLPVSHNNISLDFKMKQFLRGTGVSPALAHQRWLGSFSGDEINLLLNNDSGSKVEADHLRFAENIAHTQDPLFRSLRLYQQTYLAEDILTKVDRASMACSLEVRAPFLDAKLVDLIQRLPSDLKYGRGQTKRLLKRALADKLPRSILDRPKKGFGIPVARWLNGPLAPLLDELCHRKRLDRQGIFRSEMVSRLVGEHRGGVCDHRKPLWTLLMFQLWYDRWLDGTALMDARG